MGRLKKAMGYILFLAGLLGSGGSFLELITTIIGHADNNHWAGEAIGCGVLLAFFLCFLFLGYRIVRTPSAKSPTDDATHQ